MDPLIYLIIIVACVLISAFFSASETAFMRIRRDQLQKDIDEHKGPQVLAVRDLLKSTSRLLVTLLVGNNVVNILGAACASGLAIHYLGSEKGVAVSAAVMTVVILLFAEIGPKAVAARDPKSTAYLVAMPLYLVHLIFFPIHIIFDYLVDPLLLKIFKSKDMDAGIDTTEEILRLAKHAQYDQGVENESPASPVNIIASTAHAAELTVLDIMVSRAEIAAYPMDTPSTELLNHILREGYTRVPVYNGTLDHIVGIVHLKDLINLVRAQKNDLKEIVKPVLRVPERKPILKLLTDMQRAFVHLAIVKDEFGVTQGLVTSEDILEELVGEIRDEFDRDELTIMNKIDENTYEALGRITVLDFNRETDFEIPSERGDTLGGVIYNELGRSAHPGDSVFLDGYKFTVLDVSGTRITRVRVHKDSKGEETS